jgi:putative DNA primase/helicase
LREAIETIEARAQYEAETRTVFLRIGCHADKLYIDLGTPDWVTVAISFQGWQIITDSPVKFRRSKNMLSLVRPVQTDDPGIEELKNYLNFETEDDFVLLVAWIISAYRRGNTDT